MVDRYTLEITSNTKDYYLCLDGVRQTLVELEHYKQWSDVCKLLNNLCERIVELEAQIAEQKIEIDQVCDRYYPKWHNDFGNR